MARYKPDWPTMARANLRAAYVGKRIEIPAHYDLWMRGARYGTITDVSRDGRTFSVKMDNPRVKRRVRVKRDEARFVDYASRARTHTRFSRA